MKEEGRQGRVRTTMGEEQSPCEIGLVSPTSESTQALQASKLYITAPLISLIVAQDPYKTVQGADFQEKNLCKEREKDAT